MNPGEKEYSVWAAGGIGNECTCSGTAHGDPNCKIHGRLGKIKKADWTRLLAAESILDKCGYAWSETAKEYRPFNVDNVWKEEKRIYIILIQSTKDPTHIFPMMNARNDPGDRGICLCFSDIGSARAFKSDCDRKWPHCKHHVIELPTP